MKFETLYKILDIINKNKYITYYEIQLVLRLGLSTVQTYISHLENFNFVDGIKESNNYKWFITNEGYNYLLENKKIYKKLIT